MSLNVTATLLEQAEAARFRMPRSPSACGSRFPMRGV